MPNYTRPFAELGAGAGSALGGGLTGLLGQISGLADAPRKAIWNGVTGLFGDPTDSGSELLGRLGMDPDSMWTQALGTGLEMATDPLTWMGALGGATRGAKLGANAGGYLEREAIRRGPNYAGGAAKFVEAGVPPTRTGRELYEAIVNSPHAEQMAREVPPGSQLLRAPDGRVLHGQQALVYKTPTGDTLRIAPDMTDPIDALHRPAIPEMLPANRAGMVGPNRLERAPLADTKMFDPTTAETPVDRFKRWTVVDRRNAADPKVQMADAIRARGFDPVDVHSGNLGMYQNRPVVIDPGAVLPREGGPQLPQLPDWSTQQPGRFTNWLLDRLGSDRTLQQELARGAGGF